MKFSIVVASLLGLFTQTQGERIWQCLDGINVPIRRGPNNVVQCLSENSKDCLWQNSKESCQKLANNLPRRIRPLTCGGNHQHFYGITGFESPNHWCYKGRAYLDQGGIQYTCANQWQCVHGINTPISFTKDGDVQCMSLNNRDCTWQPNAASCESILLELREHPNLKPLVCGRMHNNQWGSSGYGDPNHWCARGRYVLGQFEKPYTPWECVKGYNVPVRLGGTADVECMSNNGRDCLWQSSYQGCENLLRNPQGTAPLTCGAPHKAVWGGPGYENPNHWCVGAQEYLGN